MVSHFSQSGCADTNFVSQLASGYQKTQQCLWEAILYHFLKEKNGYDVKSHGNEGPDFFIVHEKKRIHIEAIAPRFDKQITNFNADDNFETGVFQSDRYIERWSGAFIEKHKKYNIDTIVNGKTKRCYISKGIVAENDIQIIAISNTTSEDLMDFYSLPPEHKYPYINEYLYPFTTQQVAVTSNGNRVISSRKNFLKENSIEVAVGIFLDKEYENISAVLLHDYKCTKDWVLVHNINAKNPLANSFLKCAAEWTSYKEGDSFIFGNIIHS